MIRLDRLLIVVFAVAVGACAPAATDTPAVVATHTVEATEPTPVLDSEQNVDEALVLSTNEPFWNARVEGSTLQLSGMEGERTLVVDSNERLLDGRHVMAHDNVGTIEIRVTDRACQDSMSGADFPYTGTMAFDGGDEIMGCARRASDPRPEPSEEQ